MTGDPADYTAKSPERPRTPSGDVSLDPGAKVGRYEVVRFLSEGGMGAVYLARDPAVPRSVALKIIPRGADDKPDVRARFQREVRAAAQLAHPNIVRLFDVGEEPAFWYYTMEYVDGPSLARVMKDVRPLPPRTGFRIARDVARALSHAHEKGIVHRDLKPGNILLVPESPVVDAPPSDSALAVGGRGFVAEYRAVLADFGLAREVRAATALTLTGHVLGTPLYMSPEQAAGRTHEADARSDVYSLGAVLYEMATGLPPASGRTTLEVLEAVRTRDPIPPRRIVPALSRDAETVILKALAKERERRYATAAAFAEDLERYLRGEDVRARPPSVLYRMRRAAKRRPAVAAIAAMLLLGAVAACAFVLGPGWIYVTSNPPGAAILVNGEPTGLTAPARVRVWPAFRVRVEGRVSVRPVEGEPAIELECRPVRLHTIPWVARATTAQLTAATGFVRLDVDPADADVLLAVPGGEDIELAAGARFARLPVGVYQYLVDREGYEVESGAIVVAAGKTSDVSARLRPQTGQLVVTASVDGGRMKVEPIAVTAEVDERVYAIPIGEYEQTEVVRLKSGERLIGWRRWEGLIELRGGGWREFSADDVERVSYDVDMLAGGLPLPVGRYRLTFEKENHFARTAEVAIARNEVASVNATLTPIEKWRFKTDGAVTGRPALGDLDGDGALDIVVGSDDGNVYALSGRDGSILWRAATQGGVWSSPALGDLDADGTLDAVVGSLDHHVYALSGRDGSILWRAATQGNVASSPALGDFDGDGKLDCVVGSDDWHLYAISGRDGSTLWRAQTNAWLFSSPVVGDLDGDGILDVVTGSQAHGVYALSGRDGSTLWCAERVRQVSFSPALGDLDGDGALDAVVGSLDQNVYALSGRDGAILWRARTGGEVFSSPALGDADGDGTLDAIVGSDDFHVYALSGRDGSIVWRAATQDRVISSPALGDLDGDRTIDVVVGSHDSHVYALSGRHPAVLWRAQVETMPCSFPGLGDLDGDKTPDVVVGSSDRHVYALSGRDGSTLWRVETGDWVRSSPALGDLDADGRLDVVVGSNDENVYALSGRDGAILWRAATQGWVESSPALGDLDGDGTLDAVVGGGGKNVYALSGRDGSILWRIATEEEVRSSPALGDLDGDGAVDVVVGGGGKNVYALSGRDGSTLWRAERGVAVWSFLALGDLDGDGMLDVVANSDDKNVYALSGRDGSTLWRVETGDWVRSSPALADLDADGTFDAVVGSHDHNVYALSGRDGAILWRAATQGAVQSSPALGDLDGDGAPDAVVGSNDDSVYALSGRDGSVLWRAATQGEVPSSPALSDLDGDGTLDAVVGSSDQSLYAFRIGLVRLDPLRAARRDLFHSNPLAAERHATRGISLAPSPQLHLARAGARFAREDWTGALEDLDAARALGVVSPGGAMAHLLAALLSGREPDLDLVAAGLAKSPSLFLAALVDLHDAFARADAAAFRAALARIPPPEDMLARHALGILLGRPVREPTLPSLDGGTSLVRVDYAWAILSLSNLLDGDADQASAHRALASYTEPGRRFAALWPRDAAELRALLRLPEPDEER